MFRNLFAICTTLVLGAAGASASTTTATPDLEQRIQAAKNTINALPDVTDQQTARDGEKVAQYWGNYYRPRWRDWSNWGNYRRYYY
jgi:hypothetical protein